MITQILRKEYSQSFHLDRVLNLDTTAGALSSQIFSLLGGSF
jgi:hypothetical protein